MKLMGPKMLQVCPRVGGRVGGGWVVGGGAHNYRCIHIRIGVLEMFKLKPEQFGSIEVAMNAADVLIAEHKEANPGIEKKYPDKIRPNFKLLDEFYFSRNNSFRAAKLIQ